MLIRNKQIGRLFVHVFVVNRKQYFHHGCNLGIRNEFRMKITVSNSSKIMNKPNIALASVLYNNVSKKCLETDTKVSDIESTYLYMIYCASVQHCYWDVLFIPLNAIRPTFYWRQWRGRKTLIPLNGIRPIVLEDNKGRK